MDQIIHSFVFALKEFFQQAETTNCLKTGGYPAKELSTGIRAIHRVFEFVFLKTGSPSKAFQYAQKAGYYYLEYIEQVSASSVDLGLNLYDAILFVYKKTILEDETLIPLTNPDQTIYDLQPLLQATNTFFQWNNAKVTFYDRQTALASLLEPLLLTFVKEDGLGKLIVLLDTDHSDDSYIDFLNKIRLHL